MAIYLDHAATTPCRREVVAAMLPYFGEIYGNPVRSYRQSRQARAALDEARAGGARLGCEPREIVFTSGGSESDNLALKGVAWAARHRVAATISSSRRRASRRPPHAADLAAQGFPVIHLPVEPYRPRRARGSGGGAATG